MSEKTNSDQHVVITGDTTPKSETTAREKEQKMAPPKPTDLATSSNNYNISKNVDLESDVLNSPEEVGLMSNSEDEISDAEIVNILKQIAAKVGISEASLVSQPPFSLISTDPSLGSSNDEPGTANRRSNSDEDPNNLALNELRITQKRKKDVDWKKFLKIMDDKIESLEPSNNLEGQVSLHDHLFEAIRDSIVPFSQNSNDTQRPKRGPSEKKISPPWWTPECAEQVQYRSNAYRIFRKNPSVENYDNMMKRETETKKAIRNAKRAVLMACESSNRDIPISLILNRIKTFRHRLLNLNPQSADEVESELNDTREV